MTRRRVLVAVLIAFTIVTRYAQLGDRFFHHDESIHAWMSSEFLRGHGYHYDPVYHGPLLYHLEAATFFLFGEGDLQARLVPATVGVGLVVLCVVLLRRTFGDATAMVAASLMAASPTFTYYSRFNSHDILIALFTLVLMWTPFQYARTGDRRYLMWSAAVLALAVGTKLNAFFVVAALGAFALAAVAAQTIEGRRIDLAGILKTRGRDLAIAVALTAMVLALLFETTFLYHVRADGLSIASSAWLTAREAAWGGFDHWLSIHNAPRLPGPPYYYVPLMIVYDPLIVVSSLTALIALAVRRWKVADRPELAAWLIAAVVQSALYAIAGEKVPWLTMHVLLPWIVVSSAFLADAWSRWPLARVPVAVVAAGGLALTLHASWALNTRNREDPVEPLLQVVYGPDVSRVVASTQAVAASTGEPTIAMVESPVTWPFGWYLRDAGAGYPSRVSPDETAPVLIGVDDGPREGLSARYDEHRYVYYRWSTWIENVRAGDVAGLWHFMLAHDRWGDEHTSTFRVWTRQDTPASAR